MTAIKRMFAAVLAVFLLLLCSCTRGQSEDAVATVNGKEVPKALFEVTLQQVKAELSSEIPEDAWETAQYEGKSALEYAKEHAYDMAVDMIAVEKMAEEDGLSLSEAEQSEIDTYLQQMESNYGGRENLEQALQDQLGLTLEEYRRYFFEYSYYRSALAEKHVSVTDEEVLAAFHTDVARVKHILILTVDQTTNQPLSEEEQAAALQTAQELLARAQSGEDFDALVAEYSQDPGSAAYPDGYYVAEGVTFNADGSVGTSMVPEFEAASLALEIEGISDIVETDYGYHIIKRYPISDEVAEACKENFKPALLDQRFEEVLKSWKDGAAIIRNDEVYNAVS